MALPKTDTFTGTNGTELHAYDAGWVKYRGDELKIVIWGNSIQGDGNAHTTYGWEGDGAFGDDQYAQIKCTAIFNGTYLGIVCRAVYTDATHKTWYGFFGAPDDGFYLYYFNNDNSEHDLVHYTDADLEVDDVLRLEVSGSSLVCKLNGGTIISTTDSTISGGGVAGVNTWGAASCRGDDFEGGNLENTSSIIGSTAWGHTTSAQEGNLRSFSGNWTGTGMILGTGDTEKVLLSTGNYLESEVINSGINSITLTKNKYGGNNTSILYYRTGSSVAACQEASWQTYSGSFASTGYSQIRVEHS